jgi:hypothetical protein
MDLYKDRLFAFCFTFICRAVSCVETSRRHGLETRWLQSGFSLAYNRYSLIFHYSLTLHYTAESDQWYLFKEPNLAKHGSNLITQVIVAYSLDYSGNLLEIKGSRRPLTQTKHDINTRCHEKSRNRNRAQPKAAEVSLTVKKQYWI